MKTKSLETFIQEFEILPLLQKEIQSNPIATQAAVAVRDAQLSETSEEKYDLFVDIWMVLLNNEQRSVDVKDTLISLLLQKEERRKEQKFISEIQSLSFITEHLS